MAELISIRVTKEMPSIEQIENAAAGLGLNKNQLIAEGIKMMCFWDKEFYAQMKTFADGTGLTMAQVMQNFLIRRLAEDAAERKVYGDAPRALMELPMTTHGLITGKELFDILYEDKVKELYRERAQQIMRDLENGFPEIALSEQDKEILKKYGNA